MRCVACGTRCVSYHWMCCAHRHEAAACMKARRVTEPEFLRELVFKFPRTARGRAEFEARFIFVAAVWQRTPARRRVFLLRTYGLVGHTHIAMGVDRDVLVELSCALVDFWSLHVRPIPEIAQACVDRVALWYAEIAAWDVRSMMRAERMVVALRAQGRHTVLLFHELAVALARVPPDAVLRIYHEYLALLARSVRDA
jgi:hypothetical protein